MEAIKEMAALEEAVMALVVRDAGAKEGTVEVALAALLEVEAVEVVREVALQVVALVVWRVVAVMALVAATPEAVLLEVAMLGMG